MVPHRCYIQTIHPDAHSLMTPPIFASILHTCNVFCITATMHDPRQGGIPYHKHTASSSWAPPAAKECLWHFDSINFSLASSGPRLSSSMPDMDSCETPIGPSALGSETWWWHEIDELGARDLGSGSPRMFWMLGTPKSSAEIIPLRQQATSNDWNYSWWCCPVWWKFEAIL